MKGFIQKIGTSFGRMWSAREELSLKHIRPKKLHYSLAYMFLLSLSNMWASYFSLDTPIFGIPTKTLMYVGHVIVSVAVMLLWSDKFKWLIYVSSGIAAASVLPLTLLPEGLPKSIFAIICWAGLGGCSTASRVGFAFASNNVERLVTVFGAFIITDIIYIFLGLHVKNAVMTVVLPIIFVVGVTLCLNLYREDEIVAKEDASPSDRRTVFIAMAYMISYYAIDGFLVHIMNVEGNGYVWVGLGSLVAIGIFMLVHVFFKRNVWNMWNLIFAFALIMAVIAAFPNQANLENPRHLFVGLTLVGAPTSLYMLGCVQKRYASIKLLQQCTILLILFLPVMIIGADLIAVVIPDILPLVLLLFVIAVVVGFTLATPATYKYLFSADWMEELHSTDMTLLRDKVEQEDRFQHYGLTPREKEVAALLLSAYTVRMVAGELKISQSTVNMHTANLYRKLDINSKAELFKKFGVADETEAKSSS